MSEKEREGMDGVTREQLLGMSRYVFEVGDFGVKLGAKAAYCFVLDGVKGSGGCPVVIGHTSHAEYLERCRQLVGMLRRSADLLERDIGEGQGCAMVNAEGEEKPEA